MATHPAQSSASHLATRWKRSEIDAADGIIAIV